MTKPPKTPKTRPYSQCTETLEQRIPGLKIDHIGGSCPFQIEAATPDGNLVYFRYRHDEATLYVYPNGGDLINVTEYAELTEVFGEPQRGHLDDTEAADLFVKLWDARKPKTATTVTGQDRMLLWAQAFHIGENHKEHRKTCNCMEGKDPHDPEFGLCCDPECICRSVNETCRQFLEAVKAEQGLC